MYFMQQDSDSKGEKQRVLKGECWKSRYYALPGGG